MAPRPPQARRTLAPQGEHIYELGVVGRKTGVTVPDSGVRDEHGMEPIENLFSSPGKDEHGEESDDDGGGEEAMDITTTSGVGPASLLNGHGGRPPVPLSRVRSPAKTLLRSPAQRNRLLARNSSSPARGAVVRGDGSKPSSQPTADQFTAKRRLDFRSVASGGPHSLSQPVSAHRLPNGHRLQPLGRDDDDDDDDDGNGHAEEEGEHAAEDDEVVNNFVEESMAMLDGGDDYGLPAHPESREPPDGDEQEDEVSVVEEDDPPAPASKRRGRPPKQKEVAPPKSAKPPKKPARQVVEEKEDQDHEVSGEEQEEEEPTQRPQKPAPGRRGRPPKAPGAPAPAAQPPARGSQKRRSLEQQQREETPAADEPSPEPQPKRQRTSPTAAKSKVAGPKKPSGQSSAAAAAAAKAPKRAGRGRPRKSSADAGDVSQVAVARRPPLPKSRGLLINRREVPGDASSGSSMFRTRSGRTSFRPLAYWRNERVDYDKDEAEDAFVGRTRRGRFVLPSVKEVVRVDEPEPEPRPPRSRRGGGGAGKGRGRARRRSRGGLYEEDDEDDEGPAEVWELDPGTVTGEVVVWQPEYEFQPPAPNDLVSVMDKQLAISGAAIKTTEVVGGEFRYAKVFSEGFIGAGVVDLPPGAVKRLKNSRKVFMIFFVHAGRVLVTVQETSFRISKGGIFIVPRYNEYTIENDYDHPARIFFAQGQEMSAKPPAEEQGAEEVDGRGDDDDDDDDDVDGEEEEVEVTEGEEEASEEE